MSVVVAIKDKDKVWVGCDSQVTCGWSKYTLKNKNNFKIFKPTKENDVIIGVCGYLRDANILSCVEEYLDELAKLKNEIDFKYIVTKLVPKLFSILRDNKRIVEKKEQLTIMESQILFIYKDKIFDISPDGCVIEIEDYCAIGSGTDFAIGYLNNNEEKDIKQKIIKAIQSSCLTDLYVNYPIVVMNTKDNEVEIVEK